MPVHLESTCARSVKFVAGLKMSGTGAPTPDRLISAFMAYRLTAIVRAGIEIDIFTAIAEGHLSPDALAPRCKADARGIRILADSLTIHALLTKKDDTYALTEESARYLNRLSPHYLGAAYSFSACPALWDQYGRLTEIVRQGGARSQDLALAPNNDLWLRFARDGADDMAKTARAIIPSIQKAASTCGVRRLKILDVAAGHGMFGITFAGEDPACRIVAQDRPNILEVLREHATAHGVADRFTFLPGDIQHVDVGSDYDVVMIPNLIHYMGRQDILQLFRKVRAALKPGGILAVIECAPDDNRIWPPPFGAFAMFSLVTSADGDAYTVNEILDMCRETGFENRECCDLPWERLILATNPKPAPGQKSTPMHAVVVTGPQFPAPITAAAPHGPPSEILATPGILRR
jgi:ubiquinone/menaquinone biosynthesis C-methylase UbiE